MACFTRGVYLGNLRTLCSCKRAISCMAGAELKPGVYILQMNTGTGVYSRKVSVIR